MKEKPEIYVSTFPYNMQNWYEEKLTLALNALSMLKDDINSLNDDISRKKQMEYEVDTAKIYVETVLDVSAGV